MQQLYLLIFQWAVRNNTFKSTLCLRYHWTRMQYWWRNGMLVFHNYLKNRLKYIILQINCFSTFSAMVLKTHTHKKKNVFNMTFCNFAVKILEKFVWCIFQPPKLTSSTVILQKISAATYRRTFLKTHLVVEFIII